MSKYDGHITALRGEVQFRKNQAQHYLELAQRADSELKELREKNAKLEAEAQALRADAERYRWLRDKCHLFEHYRAMKWRPDAFEAEIDNAMRASKA